MDDSPKTNIKVRDNNIQLVDSQMLPLIVETVIPGMFENNIYFTSSDLTNWFRADEESYSYDDWVTLATDAGSSNEQQIFQSPERTFETYLSSIGLSPDIDTFVESIANLPVRTWDDRFSAETINTYIREGYGNTTCE